MRFFNDNSQLNHSLQVSTVEDFFGRIGGIFDIFLWILQSILGSYILFESRLRWMKKFYKFKSKHNEDIGKVLK